MSLDFEKLRETRASNPEALTDAYKNRKRRKVIEGDGKIFVIAADHPARGALAVRDDATAMADRYKLLERLAIALENPGVDGVLGTPDILDDLALLGLLDGKLAVASMNRVGLKGASFEMDDRFAQHNFEAIKRDGLDMAKNGLAAGDVVTIQSRRGEVAIHVRQDDGTPNGVVFIPFAYYEAAANKLTNSAYDPVAKIPEFKYCAVRVEKVLAVSSGA